MSASAVTSSTPKNLYIREGVYYARIYDRGREHRECLRTTSEKIALKRLAEVRARLHEAAEADEHISFKRAVVEWSTLFVPGLKAKTQRRYEVSLTALDRAFSETFLHQISAKTIGAFVAQRRTEGVTNQTIKNDLSALSGILRVAVSNGWITENVARTWDRRMLRHKGKVRQPPDRAAVARVVATGGYRGGDNLCRLVDFLHRSGARLMEGATLRWGQVDLQAGTVTFLQTKNGRPRVLRLKTKGGDAGALLRAMPRHPATDLVFWHGEGKPFRKPAQSLAWLYKAAARAEAEAGRPWEPFRTHDLRHSFAIGWLNAGGDIYELSRHLGHGSVKTTEIYLRWMDPAAKDGYMAQAGGEEGPNGDRHKTGTRAEVFVPEALEEAT